MARKRTIDPLDISIPKLSDALRDVQRHGNSQSFDDIADDPTLIKKRTRRKIAVWHKQPMSLEDRNKLLASMGRDKRREYRERLHVERNRSVLYLARYPETGEKLPDELMQIVRILDDNRGVLTHTELATRMQAKQCPRPFEMVLRAYAHAALRFFVVVPFVSASAASEAARRGNPYLDLETATLHQSCPLCSVEPINPLM